MKLFTFLIFLFTFFISAIHPSFSQTIIQNRSFNYGLITINDNSSAHSMTIATNGTITNNPVHITIFQDGETALFSVSGFDASTQYSISIPDTTISYNGTGPQYFDIVSMTISPAIFITDPSGEGSFTVGSTFRTSGNGTGYPQGSYTGNVLVTINN